MKIIYLSIFAFLLINIAVAQKNILFKTVEPDNLEKYIALGDINFIWAFSKNSCTFTEDSLLFENPEVVKFYSKFFSCYSISVDSTFCEDHELNKINKPGYYFVDPSFTVVHKHLKNIDTSKDLIQLGIIALDTSLRYNAIMHRFYSGDKNISFLIQYLDARKNSKELTTKDIDDFVSQIDSSNKSQPEIREFIYNYFFCRTYDNGYYYFVPGSTPFELLINNRDLFTEEYDVTQIDLRINALLNFGLRALIQNKNVNLIVKSAKFFNDTIPTYKLKDTDGNILLYLKGNKNDTVNKLNALKAFYYLEIGDTTNFKFYEGQYLELSKNNPVGLFFIANYYFRNIENPYFIKKSENILKKAYELDTNNYEIVGLLAEILYNNNKYEEAIFYIEKAIRLYRENEISPSQFLLLEENIHKKLYDN